MSRPAQMSRQSVSEHEYEPIRGIPGHLPAGETLLWQGAPQWWGLAKSMHVRGLAVYFALLIAVRALTAWNGDPLAVAITVLELLGVSLAALGLLALFAWLVGRTTVYSLTDRRFVLRYGVALSKAINIPFNLVANAAVRLNADGSGDIVLRLEPGSRLPYLILWPHARPWRTTRAEPMLRAIPDAATLAQRLARALAAATGGQVEAMAPAAAADRGLEPTGAVTA